MWNTGFSGIYVLLISFGFCPLWVLVCVCVGVHFAENKKFKDMLFVSCDVKRANKADPKKSELYIHKTDFRIAHSWETKIKPLGTFQEHNQTMNVYVPHNETFDDETEMRSFH